MLGRAAAIVTSAVAFLVAELFVRHYSAVKVAAAREAEATLPGATALSVRLCNWLGRWGWLPPVLILAAGLGLLFFHRRSYVPAAVVSISALAAAVLLVLGTLAAWAPVPGV
ncbi:MAG: hypothetical protein ACOC7T_03460 [Planctomycetota bacterium]